LACQIAIRNTQLFSACFFMTDSDHRGRPWNHSLSNIIREMAKWTEKSPLALIPGVLFLLELLQLRVWDKPEKWNG